MGIAANEAEVAKRTARFLKAEMKRAGVTYSELAKRLAAYGVQEKEASITSKLACGTFAAAFFSHV
jgi:hypothetical protein